MGEAAGEWGWDMLGAAGSQRFGPPAQPLLMGYGESRRCGGTGSREVRAAGGIVPIAWEAETMHVLTQPVAWQMSAKALVRPGRSAGPWRKGLTPSKCVCV